jgi:KDO2-lipid IV(A) lauroyltransferase
VSISVRHRAEYAVVAAVSGVVRRLPQSLALRVGDAIGLAFHAIDRPHRLLARANLAGSFPHKPPDEIRRIARGVFRHFGRLLIELLRFHGLSHAQKLALVEFDGIERAVAATAAGKGALYITGHFGFWELQAIAHAMKQPPIAVVARALDNPLLHALVEQVRGSTGNYVIYRQGGARRILRALQQNHGVAVLIDQHISGADAVNVEFFNRPAATTSAVAALALRTGAPVIPVFALPLPDGRYRMIYEHPVEPPDPTHPDAIREFTQRCTDVLEMYVRRYPDLWLWMHRRWRDVPRAAEGMFPHAQPDDTPIEES